MVRAKVPTTHGSWNWLTLFYLKISQATRKPKQPPPVKIPPNGDIPSRSISNPNRTTTEVHQAAQGGDSKRRLIWHGMFLFLLGLPPGFVETKFANTRMGLAAHLEGLMNGTFLIALGAVI